MERWTGGLPLVRLGRRGVPEDEMSVGAPGKGAQVESGQVASWSSSWKSLAGRRGFPEGVKVDVSWPRAGLMCTCAGAGG